MSITAREVAQRIDHTLLKPEATPDQIDTLCDEAIEYGFCAVCVNPVYARRVAQRLDANRPSDPATHHPCLASVAGFPLGATTTESKADEARRAVEHGAAEIDMVVPLGALVAGNHAVVTDEIEAVAQVLHHRTVAGTLKVILETAALTPVQIEHGCRCCRDGGADFVKTSTGFHPAGGATVDDVRLLKRFAGTMRVKASGGIRSAHAALDMLGAGADRIGTSSGVALLNELNRSTA
jgi:deoxyribose-phosphate aldolase